MESKSETSFPAESASNVVRTQPTKIRTPRTKARRSPYPCPSETSSIEYTNEHIYDSSVYDSATLPLHPTAFSAIAYQDDRSNYTSNPRQSSYPLPVNILPDSGCIYYNQQRLPSTEERVSFFDSEERYITRTDMANFPGYSHCLTSSEQSGSPSNDMEEMNIGHSSAVSSQPGLQRATPSSHDPCSFVGTSRDGLVCSRSSSAHDSFQNPGSNASHQSLYQSGPYSNQSDSTISDSDIGENFHALHTGTIQASPCNSGGENLACSPPLLKSASSAVSANGLKEMVSKPDTLAVSGMVLAEAVGGYKSVIIHSEQSPQQRTTASQYCDPRTLYEDDLDGDRTSKSAICDTRQYCPSPAEVYGDFYASQRTDQDVTLLDSKYLECARGTLEDYHAEISKSVCGLNGLHQLPAEVVDLPRNAQQAGYTSVIVDAQQYQLANGFVH